MTRLRRFLNEHRAAAAIIAVAVAAFALWKISGALGLGPAAATSAVRPGPSSPPAGTATAAAPGGGAPGSAALRAAGHLTGVAAPTLPGTQPSTGAAPDGATSAGASAAAGRAPTGQVTAPATAAGAQAASGPPPAGTGRPDPFVPLVSSGGPAAVTNNPPLPPVPPLSPTALGPAGSPVPGAGAPAGLGLPEPRAQFHLTGIVFGPEAVAILNDGAVSYVAAPGDALARGVRVVAIDGANDSVTLAWNNQSWQLRLEGGTSR